jgi:hypothetical protein
MRSLNPRRYDRLDAALSFGLFLARLFLLCFVVDDEGRKLAGPAPLTAAGDLAPLSLGMN